MKRQVTSLIPYRFRGGEYEFYLQRRTQDAHIKPGHLGFFGGGIEDGESVEQGMLREIKEELKFLPQNYQFFGRYEFIQSTMFIFILSVANDFESKVTVCEGEYGKFFTMRDLEREEKVAGSVTIVLDDFFKKHSPDN